MQNSLAAHSRSGKQHIPVSSKRTYHKPVLQKHGDVRDLTMGGSLSTNEAFFCAFTPPTGTNCTDRRP